MLLVGVEMLLWVRISIGTPSGQGIQSRKRVPGCRVERPVGRVDFGLGLLVDLAWTEKEEETSW